MISHIAGGRYIHISGNSSMPHVPSYGSAQGVGNVRYNTNNTSMEVYDGSNWINMTSYASIELTPEAQETIMWAHEKMKQELQLKSLMEKHPGLKDAYEKFEIMKILVTQEEQK